MAKAVELATVVADQAQLGPHVVRGAILGALTHEPIRTVAGQAALAGCVAQLAENRVTALLAEPEALLAALVAAKAGAPLCGADLGVTRELLFREAGLAAARL